MLNKSQEVIGYKFNNLEVLTVALTYNLIALKLVAKVITNV
jgi:hypothetical protein